MRIHLASTRVRRIRSVYPEISVYALQSWNFCIHCVSGYVWTPVSVYFCIRWRHSIRTSLSPRKLCWLILWDVRIRIGYVWTVVYASCGRRYFCIRIKKKKIRIQKSPDTYGRGLKAIDTYASQGCVRSACEAMGWLHGKGPFSSTKSHRRICQFAFARWYLNACYDVRDNSAFTTRLQVNKAWRITTFLASFKKWGNLSFWTATHTVTIS